VPENVSNVVFRSSTRAEPQLRLRRRREHAEVVGLQKLVPTLEAAHERIVEHSLRLEDARAYAAYG
jgi:hypothetical protein